MNRGNGGARGLDEGGQAEKTLSDFMKRNSRKCRLVNVGAEKVFDGVAHPFCHFGRNRAGSAIGTYPSGYVFNVAIKIFPFEMEACFAFAHGFAALRTNFSHFFTSFSSSLLSIVWDWGHTRLQSLAHFLRSILRQREHKFSWANKHRSNTVLFEGNLQ